MLPMLESRTFLYFYLLIKVEILESRIFLYIYLLFRVEILESRTFSYIYLLIKIEMLECRTFFYIYLLIKVEGADRDFQFKFQSIERGFCFYQNVSFLQFCQKLDERNCTWLLLSNLRLRKVIRFYNVQIWKPKFYPLIMFFPK